LLNFFNLSLCEKKIIKLNTVGNTKKGGYRNMTMHIFVPEKEIVNYSTTVKPV